MLLGSRFLTHPPICEFRVEVKDGGSPLTRGLGSSFVVEDEPYFIELQDPAATRILLTADYGAAGDWPAVNALYGADGSLQADGRSRVVGYSREVGEGGIASFVFGHCHNPGSRAPGAAERTDAPPVFRTPWENPAVTTLLQNAIAWGVGG